MSTKSIVVASLASMASAHMLMVNPVPFVPMGVKNAPLDASGSDFPCRTTSFTGVQPNVYAAGSTQQLEFQGTAVHGGGSCQVSVTTDAVPTKNSVWKVIKSIEGGCPAKNTPGNLEGNNPDVPAPFKYDFTIPDLAAGSYTLAWTWFNKIGNREMYMNCAPLEVTGGTGKTELSSLPDMLVANIGNGCSTTEGTDVQFPNPGSEVEQLNGATSAFGPPIGTCTGSPGTPGPAAGGAATPVVAPAGGANTAATGVAGGANTVATGVAGGANTVATGVAGGANTVATGVAGGANTAATGVAGGANTIVAATPIVAPAGGANTVATGVAGGANTAATGAPIINNPVDTGDEGEEVAPPSGSCGGY